MLGLFHKILVPVDFSPCSDAAFKTAVQLAHASKLELVMLHVIDTGTIAHSIGSACWQSRPMRQYSGTLYRQ